MRNRGLEFTEEEFAAFVATEKEGSHLLQNIKLTMKNDALKALKKNQQPSISTDLVSTNKTEQRSDVLQLKTLLESRGMHLSDSELVEFVASPKGKELLKQIKLLNSRKEDARMWGEEQSIPPAPQATTSLSQLPDVADGGMLVTLNDTEKRLQAILRATKMNLSDVDMKQFVKTDRGPRTSSKY